MTTIDDYATFLTARWDEIEIVADRRHAVWCDLAFPITGPECGCGHPDYLRADLAAKRAILEWHQNWPVLIEGPPESERIQSERVDGLAVRASVNLKWATEQEYVKRFGTSSPAAPILRMLASPFRNHPDHPENQENRA